MVAEHDPDSLKDQFTQTFDLQIQLFETEKSQTIDDIKSLLDENAPTSSITELSGNKFNVSVPYRCNKLDFTNHTPLMKGLEQLENDKRIEHFKIVSSNLEKVFHNLVQKPSMQQDRYLLDGLNGNGHGPALNIDDNASRKMTASPSEKHKQSGFDVVKNLFFKRFLHFQRNYKLILCVLVLPTMFEMIAMGFMTLRPPGEYDIDLQLSRNLYSNSTEFYR